jgi:hypothetical protein
MNWQKPSSERKSPEPKPGPGQYYPVAQTDKKPRTMFIPRSGLRPKPRLYNNGSIKADFVNFDEEIEFDSEMQSPGPGAYMPEQRSYSQNSRYASFGSGQQRFKYVTN